MNNTTPSTNTSGHDESTTDEDLYLVLNEAAMRAADSRGLQGMLAVVGDQRSGEWHTLDDQDWIQPLVQTDGLVALRFETDTERLDVTWTTDRGFWCAAHDKTSGWGAGGECDWFDITRWLDNHDPAAGEVRPILRSETEVPRIDD